jgi:hypothetical protein
MAKIYHYTKINTLEKILKSKLLRLNRLYEGVDDDEEYQYASGPSNVKVSKYIYISSWTRKQEEIPDLWERYGDNYKGVRIGLDEDFLVKKPSHYGGNFYIYEPLAKDWKDCLAPQIFNEAKLYDIQYVENNEERIKRLIQSEDDLINIKIKELGIYKNKSKWDVQEECRFRIVLVPDSKRDYNNDIGSTKIIKEVIDIANQFLNKKDVETPQDVYVPIRPEKLRRIEVTMGKYTTEEDKKRVCKLLGINCINRYFCKRKVNLSAL